MKISLVAALSLACFAGVASIGCAAPTDGAADAEEATDDALTGRQLPGVAAVEVAEVRAQTTVLSSSTLGAPKKVKSIVSAIKKLKSTDPQPRCLERDTTRLTFLDAAGQKLATVDTHCGGFGSISFASGKPGYAVRFDTQVVEDAKAAPFAVGDAIWGITKIELSRPGRNDTRTLTGAAMKPILDGFDLDAVPDPYAIMPRCLPSHAVAFERANSDVAYASFLCGAGSPPPASIKASFSAPNPANRGGDALAHGGITIDPRPVLRAFEN